jgi:hypothetical protein
MVDLERGGERPSPQRIRKAAMLSGSQLCL